MEQKEFQKLAERISTGIASASEVALYNYYFDSFQTNAFENEVDRKEIENELLVRINHHIEEKPRETYINPYLKTVAAVAAVFLLIWWGYSNIPVKQLFSANIDGNLADHIEPGSRKAFLTLHDGTIINLNDAEAGTVAKQGSVEIKKLANGDLFYSSNENEGSDEKNLYNTITVPKGGEYSFTLPDGSKVWLNAASSLKFPPLLNEKTRSVELSGEAYFEINKRTWRSPNGKVENSAFFVKTKRQSIEVLGTHFNINAYKDEGVTKTTLIEGAVSVGSLSSNTRQILSPGQQSQLNKSGDINIVEVDTKDALAWKNGEFYFNDVPMTTLLKELARWYNVDIAIDDIPEKSFSGSLSRQTKLSQVLTIIEKTSGIKFKVEKRKITVAP